MNKSSQTIITTLQTLHFPRWEELPELGLYMDQVLQFLNQALDPISFQINKETLTSSMINNYVKHSIIKKPYKKQYTRYHLAYLMMIACFKRVYSLPEISGLIQIYSHIEDEWRISNDYNNFMTILERAIQNVIEKRPVIPDYFKQPNDNQVLVMDVLNSIALKISAELALIQMEEKKEEIQ